MGAFAGSEIEYDLKGLFDSLSVLVGNDSKSGGDNGLEFTILGDGKELWSSGLLKKSDHPKKAEVAITGVRRLVLRVTGSGGRRGREQGDWADPKLSRR
jgi:hypothetical protein